MLQARLVIYHDIAVVLGVLGHLARQKAVDKAVAALPLGAAHDQQVIVVRLRQGVGKTHFRVIRLGHPRGNHLLGGHLRPGDVLTDIPQGFLYLYPQHLVEVGVGVGVHGQDRTLLLLAEILN